MTLSQLSRRRFAAPLAALAIVVSLYLLAREPAVSSTTRDALARRFQFTSTALPVPPGPERRFIRSVNPSYERIAGWISAVGAAVALSDIDGDGLPNDACYVDTRTNQTIVAPVPDSGRRYEPFVLDIAPLKLDATMAPMGCLPGNFKEDGRTDLIVYFWGRSPVIFLHQPENSKLARQSFVAREVVPEVPEWYTNAATTADIDGDGHVDLIFGNYFPVGSRVLDIHAPIGAHMQDSMSAAFNGGGPQLLLWSGATGTSVDFKDVSDAVPPEARQGWALAAGAADLDGDLLPELYIANDFGTDRLLYNTSRAGHPRFAIVEGRRGFTQPKSKVVGQDSFKGMGVDFADIEARGLLDFVVGNITEEYGLEESTLVFMNTGSKYAFHQGIAPFVDRGEAMGLARSGWNWDVKLEDFDNSGSLELLVAAGFVRGNVNRWPELQELAMANDVFLHQPRAWMRMKAGDDISGHDRDRFFVRDSRGRFVDVANELGLEPDSPIPSRGIATADCFGDGKMDVAVAHQWGDTVFHRNRTENTHRYLGLHLRYPIAPQEGLDLYAGHPRPERASRPAIGATVRVALPDGRQRIAQVDGGNGHSGKRSPDLLFGLGEASESKPIQVDLSWRDTRGQIARQTIQLTPGWHTVLLGHAQGEQR